jgi:hypothetical protein
MLKRSLSGLGELDSNSNGEPFRGPEQLLFAL